MKVTQQPLISLSNIRVDYKRNRSVFRKDLFTAIKDVSFTLYAGDSLGILGRNGAGKSTLLKILAGVISPNSGQVKSFGAKVALLSLQAGFEQELSGRENITLSGLLLGYKKSLLNKKIPQIIDFSELGRFIDRPVKTYSAGMRARLGFSIAYYLEPDILLVDEVLGVGDKEFRVKSAAAMKEKIQSDQTVVIVSHNADTIKSLCNKAIWIEEGEKKMYGAAADVVEAYEKYICDKPMSALSYT